MIIHVPEIHVREGKVLVSARVESRGQGKALPEVLWYEFPESWGGYISGYSDGFAAALLLLAMARGEDLQVQGRLSARLLYGLREYQRIFSAWFPRRFKCVDIKSEYCEPHSFDGTVGAVASAFSGGVDSTYTLWSHLAANEDISHYRITHALFVHGFDIRLDDKSTYLIASDTYSRHLQKLGVKLIPVTTNVRQFLEPPDWELTHGTALGSVALMLDGLLSRFYVPASFPYTDLAPWGSHLVTDHLLSTETLDIIHDGCMPRVDKIARVANWEPSQSFLRVCWERPETYNCGRCYNCVLTMISLDLAYSLQKYQTFSEPLDRSRIRHLRLPYEEFIETRRIIDRALAVGRLDIAGDLRYALHRSERALRIEYIKRRFTLLGRSILRRVGVLNGGSVAQSKLLAEAGNEQRDAK